MKRCELSTGRIRWRRQRRGALCSQGMPAHLSWDIANGEAKARQRIQRIIGRERALNATLICAGTEDGVKFFMAGDRSGLTQEQLTAIERLGRQAA